MSTIPKQVTLAHRLGHLVAAEKWEEFAEAFGQYEFITQSTKHLGFFSIYSCVLAASQDRKVTMKWKKLFEAWERFLRWRLEFFEYNPEAYGQEVINEFTPTVPKPFRESWLDPLGFPKSCPTPSLRKAWGPPSIGAISHRGPVTSIAFSNDGGLLATGSFDSTVKIWDANTGQLISNCVKSNWEPILGVAFSHDLDFIAAQGLCGVKVWNVNTGRMEVNSGTLSRLEINLAYSKDGNLVAAGAKDK